MGWECHLALAEVPTCIAVGAPWPHLVPPYCPRRRPICPWSFSATWPPSDGPPHSPSILAPSFFLFMLGLGSRPTVVVGEGGGWGRVRGSCDLEASLDDDLLFRLAMRSLKPFLRFEDIGSSSSELLSISAIIN